MMKLDNRRACSLAFLIAFAALFLQVLVHRVISAKLLNDYAFLVISLTMLGFAAAGAVLSFVQRQVLARLQSILTVVAALYGVTAARGHHGLLRDRDQGHLLPYSPRLRTLLPRLGAFRPVLRGALRLPRLRARGLAGGAAISTPGGCTSPTSWARRWGRCW